ncbi:hypothetical protein RHODGE_RHODGE_03559 [Rhodoplanes serenus]|uniref:Lipoprotein n=1 Tax=Rhodoplanes serenus TaxID=200615 RepID=A0A3S5CYK4_9BRAD|nr:hypothetical protein RHODGE_RHODGE_03559 [Rhodoplanes serenus]
MHGDTARRLARPQSRRSQSRRSGGRGAGLIGFGAVLLLALGSAGCTTASQGPAPAAAGRGPTVAFESIDGPPESVFSRLVQSLTTEAQTRQLAVVSRTTPATYRVKVYTANVVYPKKAVIHWVWDVYDADQRRAFRLSGEEPVTGAGSNTWAAADETVIRRIASSGMERLAGFLATPRTASAPAAPAAAPGAAPGPAPTRDEAAVTVAAVGPAP